MNENQNIRYPEPPYFKEVVVFYDDTRIAMMMGKWQGNKQKSLGIRWIDTGKKKPDDKGYPQGQWMLIPKKISRYILLGLEVNQKDRKFIKDEAEYQLAVKRHLFDYCED